jgi:hypothetical protein
LRGPMSSAADYYKMLAADCEARALHETEPFFRGQWEHMGANYRRLAVMADLNARNDVVSRRRPRNRTFNSSSKSSRNQR